MLVIVLLKLLVLVVLIAPNLASSCSGICKVSDLKLTNNRYDGVVIAINPNVSENPEIIENLKVSLLQIVDIKFDK